MEWLGTAIAGIAALIGGLFTAKANKKIASQNIAFQQQENELTRLREDNATQRRAQDLQRAGLSQTLAAGSPASAASMVAPQNEYKPQSLIENVSSAMNIANQVMAMKQQEANVKKTEAETTKALSEAHGQNLDNEHYLENFAMKKRGSQVEYQYRVAMTSLVDNQSRLAAIDGRYRADLLSSEIKERLSNVDLRGKQADKYVQDVVESMARTKHLAFEDRKLLTGIGIDYLRIRDMNWNYGLAEKWGLPVGQQTNGALIGGIVNTGRTLSSEFIFNPLGAVYNTFNPHSYEGDSLSKSLPKIYSEVYDKAAEAIKKIFK